ncbi:MAG TPA: hypothetical protein VK108_00140 [Pseudogracilibacillus sp.]|nr:hypothetical protein [Pseudogracilibacillus sp.]
MTKQHNEESQPLVQVTDSLLDAIGLLTSLLEEQAYKPSVDLLITIVEGMESVFKILPMLELDLTIEMNYLETSLHEIGKFLEEKDMENALQYAKKVKETLTAVQEKVIEAEK